MEVKYYNLQRMKTSYRIINNDIIHMVIAVFFNPQILKIELKEFEVHKIVADDMIECDEQTFNNRVDEVAKLTKEYING